MPVRRHRRAQRGGAPDEVLLSPPGAEFDVALGPGARHMIVAVEAELFEALLAETLPDATARDVPDRYRIARRAATLIRDGAAGNDSLVEIARELGTTLRTVESGFRDLLGVTPREYRHVVRLHRARADLRSPADGDTVSLVAMRHGLVHLGRFSVDYRELFGESPSQTLRDARGAGRALDARAA